MALLGTLYNQREGGWVARVSKTLNFQFTCLADFLSPYNLPCSILFTIANPVLLCSHSARGLTSGIRSLSLPEHLPPIPSHGAAGCHDEVTESPDSVVKSLFSPPSAQEGDVLPRGTPSSAYTTHDSPAHSLSRSYGLSGGRCGPAGRNTRTSTSRGRDTRPPVVRGLESSPPTDCY